MSVLQTGFGGTDTGVDIGDAVNYSARFNSADSAYLSKTFSTTPTLATRFTISWWGKRVKLGAAQGIIGTIGTNITGFMYEAVDGLYAAYGGLQRRIGVPVFRDTAKFGHNLIVFDSTLGTEADRLVHHFNNVRQSWAISTAVGPSDTTEFLKNGSVTYIGYALSGIGAGYNNQYLADLCVVDGSALTPSSFGRISPDTGAWVHKDPTGITWGNNGFRLQFNTGAVFGDLGTDTSGQGNTFTTVSGISVTAGVGNDWLADTPTNTYPTLNPLEPPGATLSNGALRATSSGASHLYTRATVPFPATGLWYAEGTVLSSTTSNNAVGFGIAKSSVSLAGVGLADSWLLYASANSLVYKNAVSASTSPAFGTFPAGTILQIAVNSNTDKVFLGINNTWYSASGVNDGNPSAGTGEVLASAAKGMFLYCGVYADDIDVNFGQRAFAYTPPTNFVALCTANLPTPTIGATAATQASKHFDIRTRAGTGNSVSVIDLGFSPDLYWGKSQSHAYYHKLVDRLREANKPLVSNTTDAEATETQGLMSFDSAGYTIGTSSDSTINNGGSSQTYVDWLWKANGTGVWNFDGTLQRTATMTIASPGVVTLASNGFSAGQAVQFTTSGALPTGVIASTTYYAGNISGSTYNLYDTEANAITGGATGRVNTSGSQSGTHTCEHASKISANTLAGFSIVTYTGTGANATVGHGLGVAPKFIIVHNRATGGYNWPCYHASLGNTYRIWLDLPSAADNIGATAWNNTTPTTTVFSLGTNLEGNNSATMVAYCFAEVEGFSKMGSYTGNGLVDGPFVWCGFRPRYVMFKSTGSQEWAVFDSARNTYNVGGLGLRPNGANSEDASSASNNQLDFLSNGFKLKNTAAGTGYNNTNAVTYIFYAVAEVPFKYSNAR